MDYRFKELSSTDTMIVKNFLSDSKSINSKSLIRDITSHTTDKNGTIAYKIIDDFGNILGVWCSKEFETHISLSFFKIDEKLRRHMIVFDFFKFCYDKTNKAKGLIISSADVSGFDRYVKKLENDLYLFTGFKKWEA